MADYVKLDDEGNNKKRRIIVKRRRINFWGIFILFLVLFFITSIISSIMYTYTPKLAVVPIKGAISSEKTSSIFEETISSREIAEILYSIESDDSVKAVILDINSPGGSAVASEEISKAVESLKKKKKVYALINDVGASGGFWVAVSADKVYASPMSIVGSIGVTSAGFGFENLIKEYNITYRKLTAGEYKDMGSPFREPLEEENEIIQGLLDDIHNRFISHVAVSRNMTYEEVEMYATGEIFLGTKALEIGLIDDLGYYPDVVKALENESKMEMLVVSYGPEPTLVEALGLNSMFKSEITNSQIMLK